MMGLSWWWAMGVFLEWRIPTLPGHEEYLFLFLAKKNISSSS